MVCVCFDQSPALIWLRGFAVRLIKIMLSIEKCREYLPKDAKLSDEEIEALRNALYDSVQLAFEVFWYDQNSGSKNPLRLLDGSQTRDTV